MYEKTLNWLDIVQKWSTKDEDEFEMSIGTSQASRDETKVNIYKLEKKEKKNGKPTLLTQRNGNPLLLGVTILGITSFGVESTPE